ncbi:hypothetical protein EDD86DRAFT_225838 [Gorgonomyces haynaldii]|nr:hypothetical protein EDD86DRAFT_225838 [Gorgonomyces haynaldii]
MSKSAVPLRYESILDEPTEDPEILKIRDLRAQTRTLVQHLWDAARDTGEDAIQPVAPELSDDDMSLKGSKSTVSRVTVSTKKSPRKTRNPSPKRIPIKISQKKQQKQEEKQDQEKMYNVLNRDDQYYVDLQEYRNLYPDLFTKRVEMRSMPFKRSMRQKENLENPEPEIIVDDGYHYTGYYKLDERLIPQKIDHPFKTRDDVELFEIEGIRNLAADQAPVKISVPLSLKQEPKKYKPHRRNSFEPSDSVHIGDFLHMGFKPYLWSGHANRHDSDHVSFKQELKLSKK